MVNQTNSVKKVDVLVIGAGPAGSYVSSRLNQAGMNVLVLEKQAFPRFSIGESLLPQCMSFLEKVDMLDIFEKSDFQYKNGAAFIKKGEYSAFDFNQKYSEGPATTFQVKRADFDQRLANKAQAQGVNIQFKHQVVAIEDKLDYHLVNVETDSAEHYQVEAKFILDASGFGRVLPQLFNLETPSNFPSRQSLFCHINDNISADKVLLSHGAKFDREKILVSVHPDNKDVWYWLIPFADGTASIGVVATEAYFSSIELKGDASHEALLDSCLQQQPELYQLLANATKINPVQKIQGYAANVKSLFGHNYALLGNAGEFLDPVFSSGVTIAFKSADLAADLLIKQSQGKTVCWQSEYADQLQQGVDTFRVFVEAWYDGRLQDIIFYQNASDDIRRKICSILAGYAWDTTNPYVVKAKRGINALAEICKS